MAFLDSLGLSHFWGIIEGKLNLKVNAEAGKQLSSNDYTTEEKLKLTDLHNTVVQRDPEDQNAGVLVERAIAQDGTITYSIKVDASVVRGSTLEQYVKKVDIAGAYIYRGSVTNAEALPTEGMTNGDVYNLEDTDSNVAWNGTKWDPLGPTITISAITNEEIDQIVNSAST